MGQACWREATARGSGRGGMQRRELSDKPIGVRVRVAGWGSDLGSIVPSKTSPTLRVLWETLGM